MTLRSQCLLVVLGALAATMVGGAAAAVDKGQFKVITLRHKPTGLTIRAPEGFKLQLQSGVYVLRKGVTSISFARLATSATPFQVGGALEQALGGRVIIRAGDPRHRVGQVANGRRGDTFVVERIGSRLAVTTSTSSTGRPVALETLRQIGLGARGGVSLRAPKAKPQPAIPLRPYRAPDGGATALVPVGRDWVIQSNGGTVEGSGASAAHSCSGSRTTSRCRFRPNSPPNFFALPYFPAAPALEQVFPRLSPSWKNLKVRRVLRDAILPSFSSSGMLQFDFRVKGKRWTGVATVGTDRPDEVQQLPLELLLQRHRRPGRLEPGCRSRFAPCLEELGPERGDRRPYASCNRIAQGDERHLEPDERVPVTDGRSAVA